VENATGYDSSLMEIKLRKACAGGMSSELNISLSTQINRPAH